ncbi:MAG: acyloxyacyl hydrolase [Deltaproteobacteria bacterium]|nr:acyloxyacyl hydrolase [Deltaproteobacteria bacterium]
MKKTTIFLFIFAAILLLTLPVAADQQRGDKSKDKTDAYFAISVPLTPWNAVEKYHLASPLSARGGLFLASTGKWVGVEWEYTYLAGTTNPYEFIPYVPGDSALPFSTDMAFINTLLRYPDGIFHPYIGVGVGAAILYFEDQHQQTGISSFRATSSPVQFFAGVDFDLSRHWSLGLRYRHISIKPNFSEVRGFAEPARESMNDLRLNSQSVLLELKRFW